MTVAVFLGSLLAAMALGMPIAYALILSGITLMHHLDIFDAQIVAQNIINGADSFPLMAVPFFMLAGEIMNKGGLSRRIVGVILSALSGSAVADAAALSALLIPMMVGAGHNKNRSAGLAAATGIIGPIIPPSIPFVIFGVTANLSITKLFLAGIMPGIYLALALWLTWWWEVRKEKADLPPRQSLRQLLRAVVDAFWALMLPFIIIFGLRFGVFTPTEAAVVAAVYSLFVAVVVYRELKLDQIYEVFLSAAKTTSVVMFLVAAALVSAWLITVAELPGQVVALLKPFMDNPLVLQIAMQLLIVIVGTALDITPTILILAPVLMPVVVAAGIDPIYFGVLFIVNCSIGLITPPVGVVLNVVAGVSKISMEDVIKGVLPFLLAELAVLLLLILFPPLVIVPARWFSGG
jgi:tripartite ATP-independent transporter DctM subunit